ncbi:LPXTG cell wall anchor domain-containing protein [Lactobacillus mulieris]|uniref:LPXTG cell wall anchor domain-containing protein n=1 Tax=Lactobacillus mulieris TaxID=2508708 RepID=A0AAP3M3M3_9LACO|nr:LPXTG cell wall anchor domain-containing protein [Lactobacillus mulieris]MCZ3844282.1 LPXTG cell wall anchor domain-containing protein [Lactobacillus mulieris]MCZ3875943.1 LPXTG cell wall anchor domain-containing protein [Lactobacillus mulieris]
MKKQALNVAATASHKATSATNLPTKKQVKNLPQTGTKSALLLTALGLLSLLASKLLFKRRIN